MKQSAGLSPALARWREDLAQFPDDIAIGLGPLLPRLAAAVGQLGHSFSPGHEPDGYDGVIQRGDYQRLVTSDWLLALAEPDEFLRRAVMGEHSFLKFALREPRGSRRSLVVFDAGPSQLGSPRLVHIALLIVLGRRALAAGAEFAWTTLQSRGQARQGMQPDDIRYLLAARSPFESSASHFDEAVSAFGPLAKEDDLWVVGSPACAPLSARGCSLALVSDPLRRENDVVDVRIVAKRREQALRLPLPEPRTRTQLIRNPFESPRRFEVPGAPTGTFWFSPDGKRLVMREGKGIRTRSAVAGRDGWVEPPIGMQEGRLVAATWHKKSLYSVTLRGGRLHLSDGYLGWTLRATQRAFEPNFGDAPLCQAYIFGRRRHIVLRDSGGTVWVGTLCDGELTDGSKEGAVELRPILSGVLRLVWRRGHLEYALRAADDVVELGRITLELQLFPASKTTGPVHPERIVSGFDASAQIGAFAIQRRLVTDGMAHWEVAIGLRSTEVIAVSEKDRVLGMVCGRGDKPNQQRWSLLVFSSEDGHVHAVNSSGSRTQLPGFEDGVAELVQSEVGDRLAYRTTGGKLRLIESLGSSRGSVVASQESQ